MLAGVSTLCFTAKHGILRRSMVTVPLYTPLYSCRFLRHFRRLPSPLSPPSPRHCATPRPLRRSPVWRARDVIVSTHQWCVSFVCDVEFAPLSLRFSIQNPTRALASLDSPFDGMKAVERCAILLFSHSLVLSYEFVLGEPSTTNSRDSSESSGAASS